MGTKTGTAEKVASELCLHVELAHNQEHDCRGNRAVPARRSSEQKRAPAAATRPRCASSGAGPRADARSWCSSSSTSRAASVTSARKSPARPRSAILREALGSRAARGRRGARTNGFHCESTLADEGCFGTTLGGGSAWRLVELGSRRTVGGCPAPVGGAGREDHRRPAGQPPGGRRRSLRGSARERARSGRASLADALARGASRDPRAAPIAALEGVRAVDPSRRAPRRRASRRARPRRAGAAPCSSLRRHRHERQDARPRTSSAHLLRARGRRRRCSAPSGNRLADGGARLRRTRRPTRPSSSASLAQTPRAAAATRRDGGQLARARPGAHARASSSTSRSSRTSRATTSTTTATSRPTRAPRSGSSTASRPERTAGRQRRRPAGAAHVARARTRAGRARRHLQRQVARRPVRLATSRRARGDHLFLQWDGDLADRVVTPPRRAGTTSRTRWRLGRASLVSGASPSSVAGRARHAPRARPGGSSRSPRAARGFRVLVDYAHTRGRARDVCSPYLRELCPSRAPTAGGSSCVFGCGGDRDRASARRWARVVGRSPTSRS